MDLSWAELEASGFVGYRRGLYVIWRGLRDDEKRARPHFGAHIYGGIAEKTTGKGLGLHWPAHLRLNRELGDLIDHDGTPIEVRHTEREHGGFLLHHEDPDHHRGVLVRGSFPHFELIKREGPIGELKLDRYWREDLRTPSFLIPEGDFE